MSITLQPGMIIDGRFEILSHIGQGGLGSVYKARQLNFDRIVAIKFLHASNVIDEDSRERFKREGMALSNLAHKSIPVFYNFGLWRERTPYIVMEYLAGKTLRQEILSNRTLSWQNALVITKEIAEAMAYAHTKGLVHRDLKPENVILVSEPGSAAELKVCDFGLVKFTKEGKPNLETLTDTGLLIGSVHYLSPEQCHGEKLLDQRSDIYALGCILFEMLTGSPPHTADTSVGVIYKHDSEPCPALAPALHCPAGMDYLIAKATMKQRESRYQSMKQLVHDIDLVASGNGESLQENMPARQVFPKPLIYTIAAIALILLAGIYLWTQKHFHSESSSPKDKAPGIIVTKSEDQIRQELTDLIEKKEFSAARNLLMTVQKRHLLDGKFPKLVSCSLIQKEAESADWQNASIDLNRLEQDAASQDNELRGEISFTRGMLFYQRWCKLSDPHDLKQAELAFENALKVLQNNSDQSIGLQSTEKLALCLLWNEETVKARTLLLKSLSALQPISMRVSKSGPAAWVGGSSREKSSRYARMQVPAEKEFQPFISISHRLLANCYAWEGNLKATVSEFRETLKNDDEFIASKMILQLPKGSPAKTLSLAQKANELCLKSDKNTSDILILYSASAAGILLENEQAELAYRSLQTNLRGLGERLKSDKEIPRSMPADNLAFVTSFYLRAAKASTKSRESLMIATLDPLLDAFQKQAPANECFPVFHALANEAINCGFNSLGVKLYSRTYAICPESKKSYINSYFQLAKARLAQKERGIKIATTWTELVNTLAFSPEGQRHCLSRMRKLLGQNRPDEGTQKQDPQLQNQGSDLKLAAGLFNKVLDTNDSSDTQFVEKLLKYAGPSTDATKLKLLYMNELSRGKKRQQLRQEFSLSSAYAEFLIADAYAEILERFEKGTDPGFLQRAIALTQGSSMARQRAQMASSAEAIGIAGNATELIKRTYLRLLGRNPTSQEVEQALPLAIPLFHPPEQPVSGRGDGERRP